jgi:hypothetical protein
MHTGISVRSQSAHERSLRGREKESKGGEQQKVGGLQERWKAWEKMLQSGMGVRVGLGLHVPRRTGQGGHGC